MIPDAPTKGPAEIMIRLVHRWQSKQNNLSLKYNSWMSPHHIHHQYTYLLDSRMYLLDLKILVISANRSHITSMKEKYQSKTMSSATQTDTIATITERNYVLTIVIDHLGRLEYTAHEFLGMPDAQFPPTKPPWNKPANLSKTNKFAFEAYMFATNLPHHLPQGVNAIWRELSSNAYGDTQHAAKPSIWFQQNTSLSISIVIAKHLTKARSTD